MHEYIFNMSLMIIGVLGLVTALGYHSDGRRERRRRDREKYIPASTGRFGRFGR